MAIFSAHQAETTIFSSAQPENKFPVTVTSPPTRFWPFAVLTLRFCSPNHTGTQDDPFEPDGTGIGDADMSGIDSLMSQTNQARATRRKKGKGKVAMP
jgi:hypothetical protein